MINNVFITVDTILAILRQLEDLDIDVFWILKFKVSDDVFSQAETAAF